MGNSDALSLVETKDSSQHYSASDIQAILPPDPQSMLGSCHRSHPPRLSLTLHFVSLEAPALQHPSPLSPLLAVIHAAPHPAHDRHCGGGGAWHLADGTVAGIHAGGCRLIHTWRSQPAVLAPQPAAPLICLPAQVVLAGCAWPLLLTCPSLRVLLLTVAPHPTVKAPARVTLPRAPPHTLLLSDCHFHPFPAATGKNKVILHEAMAPALPSNLHLQQLLRLRPGVHHHGWREL